MRNSISRIRLLCCVVAAVGWGGASAGEELPPLRWTSDLQAASRDALSQQRPILVRVVGSSCLWCKKLAEEIEIPAVQRTLTNWTLVSIDVDRSPGDATRLGVSGIPALRVLTPRGRLVASRDGYLDAGELQAWLSENYDDALTSVDDVLLADHEPSLLEVVRIVRSFASREATLREAAIRRLLPFPQTAAAAVVQALRGGDLSSRLAAFELLHEWHAPLEQLDPWRPETLSDEQFAAIDEWLSKIDALPVPAAQRELNAAELESARSEIELMLRADPREAAAVRERIARYGRGVLAEVRTRHQAAATDEERERLVALRYRLAAADGLALAWPGGLERLADTNPAVRQRAAEELTARATTEEQALLLEIFSDPDSLVREISLRGLKDLGGEQATAALAKLLHDPEPNVRAAVLKQLAEDSSAEMLNEVEAYVKTEEDSDLVVHAIRYLRETKSQRTVPTLLSLLEHESWQVRAEAAEAVGKLLSESRYSSIFSGNSSADNGANTVEIYDGLLNLLADADAFVVSRAVDALSNVDAKRAVEPLVRAAAEHPTLAAKIVDLLVNGSEMRAAAAPHLRDYFQRDDPAVRAAAVRGLCKTDPNNVQDVLLAAIRDSHTLVRTAAATSLLEMFGQSRPAKEVDSLDALLMNPAGPRSLFSRLVGGLWGQSAAPPAAADGDAVASPFEAAEPPTAETGDSQAEPDQEVGEEAIASPLDQWLTELSSGQHRSGWTDELHEPLRDLLRAESADERLAGSLALIPLGDADRAMPVLLAVAAEHPALFSRAAEALRWLAWPQRSAAFWQIYDVARNETERAAVLYTLSKDPDIRAADLFWEAVDRPTATKSLAEVVQSGLRHAYFGDKFYDLSSISTRMRERAVASVTPQLADGSPLKRLIAINLLLQISPAESLAAAKRLMDDSQADAALRSDAFQITLAAQPSSGRTRNAIATISATDVHRRAVALKFLALGAEALTQLPATGFTIEFDGGESSFWYGGGGQPIIPDPPRGLEVNDVLPLIRDADPETAAYAGYLVSLFREPSGLEPLLQFWRSHDASSDLDRLVYRAVAALDDSRQVPALRKIYARLDEYSKREFYWTIRIMSGPEILAFRKQIRDEVGLSNLR